MENFVKFCSPQHNILKGCNTILFGTPEYYRESNPSFYVGDPDEGKESTFVKSINSEDASDEALQKVEFIMGDKKHISVQGITIETKHQNFPIWCCSKSLKPISSELGTNLDPEYTDHYIIINAYRFARRLGELLINSFSKIKFTDHAKDFIRGLSVQERRGENLLTIFHHDVIYVERYSSVIDQGQLYHPFPESIPPQIRFLFAKAKTHEEYHEHRFAFLFQHEEYGIHQVRKEPLELQIDPVTRHLINEILTVHHDE